MAENIARMMSTSRLNEYYVPAIVSSIVTVVGWSALPPEVSWGSTTEGAGFVTERYKVFGEDTTENDQFGEFVGIGGGLSIVGSIGQDSAGDGAGAAYLFDVQSGSQVAKLVAPDADPGDLFGLAVDIDGSTAAIGAAFDDAPEMNSGSVYIFDVESKSLRNKLTSNDSVANGFFGFSVRTDNDRVLIGAPGEGSGGQFPGAAYLFDSQGGQQVHEFVADDVTANDSFGVDVDLAEDVAIVGAYRHDAIAANAGAAYVFDVSSGQQLFKLTASDGEAGDFFGRGVSVGSGYALVGAPRHDGDARDAGTVYVFDLKTGAQTLKLTSPDLERGDQFGFDVDISGDLALVGTGLTSNETVYAFDLRTGDLRARLVASDGTEGDHFGLALAVDGADVIVGAFEDTDRGPFSGSAYLFTIPEPSSIVLGALALVALLAHDRRRA